MSAIATDAYEIPREHLDFRDTIRQIVQEKVAPRAHDIDASAEYPWDIRNLFAENDILGLPFAEEHGGTGGGPVETMPISPLPAVLPPERDPEKWDPAFRKIVLKQKARAGCQSAITHPALACLRNSRSG